MCTAATRCVQACLVVGKFTHHQTQDPEHTCLASLLCLPKHSRSPLLRRLCSVRWLAHCLTCGAAFRTQLGLNLGANKQVAFTETTYHKIINAPTCVQILLVSPRQDNHIAIPDGSGIFVIAALAPLYVDTSGTVYLAQGLITQVGQLVAGSIGRGFGKACASVAVM